MSASSDEDSEVLNFQAGSDLEELEDSQVDEDSEVINFQDGSYSDEPGEPNVDDSNVASGSSSNNKVQIGDQNYEILSTTGLICSMKNDMQTIVNILLVTEPVARCLMNYFLWNTEQLVNDYYGADDLDLFFESVGISNPASVTCTAAGAIIVECGICLLPFTEVRAINFVCGHQFCDVCCRLYFEEKILNDGEANRIQCPHSSCKALVDDETILNLISEETRHRWEILTARTFVLANSSIRYCQSEDCEYAIKTKTVAPVQVICKCGYESCLECGEMWHDSITCALLKKWIVSLMEDIESVKWMKEHTKKCPKCSMNIEKNGGCNHMSCRACGHQFCWLCMQDWRLHQFRSCNQFELAEDNLSDRLIHYSVRYNNHIRSARLERGLYNSVETRMTALEGAEGLTRNQVLFLKRAVESLRQSRQLLISSYVFAFYAKRSNQLSIFEDNQRDLELATEGLSWFLEQEITDGSIATIKQKLQEKSSYCDQRRSVLLGHIHEGYDKGYWELEDLL